MNVREIIQQSIDYIENNLKAEISIDEICDAAGYSAVHYCRLFKTFVGVSPREYINRRKLLHAVYEMTSGRSKTETAFDYGFQTYAGFYKSFKSEFNCSPSEFIKSHKNNKPYKINILQEENIMISKNRAQKLLSEWGLQNEEISNICNENTGRRNSNAYYAGDNYIIKFTVNLGSVKRNISISEALARADVKSFKIIKTISGDSFVQNGEMYFFMTERIKGSQLKYTDIFNNTDLAFKIGKEIAKLHKALKTLNEDEYENADIYTQITDDIKINLNLPDGFTDSYAEKFGKIYTYLPKQIIHRDINPSNILFDNGKFSGFLDFDLSEINIRIFDICYFATSILSECFTNADIDKSIWLEILKKTVLGYDSISPLNIDEKQAIPYVIYAIQIICIEYFSKFDKYKDLARINTDMLKWIMNNIEYMLK